MEANYAQIIEAIRRDTIERVRTEVGLPKEATVVVHVHVEFSYDSEGGVGGASLGIDWAKLLEETPKQTLAPKVLGVLRENNNAPTAASELGFAEAELNAVRSTVLDSLRRAGYPKIRFLMHKEDKGPRRAFSSKRFYLG